MALPIKHRAFWDAVTAPFVAKFGNGARASDQVGYDYSWSSGFVARATTSDGTQDADLIGTNSVDQMQVGASHMRPLRTPIVFNLQANASEATQRFFVADQPYEIRAIALQYDTADGATNTAFVTKEVAGQAPGTGISVQTGTFNLNTTINVLQTAVLPARFIPGVFGPQEGVIALNKGEMLSLKIASAVTSLAGLNIAITAIPQTGLPSAVVNLNANGTIATQDFYLANRPCTITGITYVNTTPTTNTGTVTFTKDTGTTAPGGGTALLAAALNPVAANAPANTPVTPALTATASALTLAAGDRIGIKVTGTITALAGVVANVSFSNGTSAAFGINCASNAATQVMAVAPMAVAAGTAATFFIADRDYRVDDVSMVWSTAGSGNLTVTVDGSTVASGAGVSVLTDNTNAGPATTGTANTVVVGTLATSKRTIFVPSGSRLSVKPSGTLGGLAGSIVAVSLVPW